MPVEGLRCYRKGETLTPIAKVIEISAESPESFEDAIRDGIQRASESVENIKGAWAKEQQVLVDGGKVVNDRVDLKVTFVVN